MEVVAVIYIYIYIACIGETRNTDRILVKDQ